MCIGNTTTAQNEKQLSYIQVAMCVHACEVTSVMSDSVTLRTVVHQAPLSMGFSRQEYWSGLPCPPPEDLPGPGIKPTSFSLLHWQVGSLPLVLPGKSLK